SVYTYNRSLSVQQFLDDLNIERTALDRIVPPLYTQLTDGMTVTIVRVLQNEECRTEEVSFSEQRIPTSNLAPGSTEIAQAGQNGLRQVCEWITIEDGVEVSRTQRSASPLRDPVNQII